MRLIRPLSEVWEYLFRQPEAGTRSMQITVEPVGHRGEAQQARAAFRFYISILSGYVLGVGTPCCNRK